MTSPGTSCCFLGVGLSHPLLGGQPVVLQLTGFFSSGPWSSVRTAAHRGIPWKRGSSLSREPAPCQGEWRTSGRGWTLSPFLAARGCKGRNWGGRETDQNQLHRIPGWAGLERRSRPSGFTLCPLGNASRRAQAPSSQ